MSRGGVKAFNQAHVVCASCGCFLQVAGQAAPATLKAAFLDPVADSMSTEVAMQLFAKTDTDFMQMFTGGAMLLVCVIAGLACSAAFGHLHRHTRVICCPPLCACVHTVHSCRRPQRAADQARHAAQALRRPDQVQERVCRAGQGSVTRVSGGSRGGVSASEEASWMIG